MMQRRSLFVRTATLGLMLCAAFGSASAAGGLSVVAFGNSITRHGPAPAVKWTGDWGMAASSQKTDYVGQLTRLLEEAAQPVAGTQRFNLAAIEASPKEVKPGREMLSAARESDLLVVELGDNVRAASMADFDTAYARLLTQARPEKGVLVCLSTWWKSAAADALIEPACERAGGLFVFIGDIHSKPGSTGSRAQGLSDAGVLSHPGDAGMAEIAARIYKAWRAQDRKRGA